MRMMKMGMPLATSFFSLSFKLAFRQRESTLRQDQNKGQNREEEEEEKKFKV